MAVFTEVSNPTLEDFYMVAPVTVGPLTQTSTSSYVAVTGSQMDLLNTVNGNFGYSIKETGGTHGVTVKAQGSQDGTNWTDLAVVAGIDNPQSPAPTFAVSAGGSLGIGGGVVFQNTVRYVRLAIIDTSGGQHGTVSVNGYGQ